MYTAEQIHEAFGHYRNRTDRVMEVLRLSPQLMAKGINTIVNASQDFMIINQFSRDVLEGMIMGTINEKIAICRELLVRRNPGRELDFPSIFAGTPLDIETKPFFFVAYDPVTFEYVLKNAEAEAVSPKIRQMKTKKDVSFYLALEQDINALFPLRVRFRDGVSLVTVDLEE